MPEWKEAPDEIIEMAEELIGEYHPWLRNANIGFLLRSEAPRSNGRTTLGTAKKVTPEMKTLLNLDFVIWLAEDIWNELSERQRLALVDHELCHCTMNDKYEWAIRKHDLEEFNCILQRHGFWWPAADATVVAIQGHLGMEETMGRVVAVNPATLGTRVGGDAAVRKILHTAATEFSKEFPDAELSINGVPLAMFDEDDAGAPIPGEE